MQYPQLIDYHMHTSITIDARMNEVQACEQAVSLGIREIAFTNHVMLKQPDYLMSPGALTSHWQQIQTCQKRYPQLKIRLGVEMDYYPGWAHEIAATIQSYQERIDRPFDFVMGAIHEMHNIFFSSQDEALQLYQDRDLLSLYQDYFELSIEMVRSGLFDIIAHPDLIKKHTHELTPPLAFERYRSAAESFVDALLEAEVGMDVNMKGMKLKVGEPFPSVELLGLYLSRARSRGLEPILTLGSDAHTPDGVGGCLREGAMLLLGLGQETLMSFEQRKRSQFMMDLAA